MRMSTGVFFLASKRDWRSRSLKKLRVCGNQPPLYPHCCCCAACIRFGALCSCQRSFCFLYCDTRYICISGFGVVRWCLTLSLPSAHGTRKTRRVLLRARCLVLLLLRERRCAVYGITLKISCNGAETKERLCQSEHEGIPPLPKHTSIKNHFFIYGNSLYGPASWTHTKGDMSDMLSMQPTEHPCTSPPGSTGSEHMRLYPSCACLPEFSFSRANATGALEA